MILPLKPRQFGIYHQTDVRIGRAHRRGVGWFSATADAQVNGQKLTVKRYGSSRQDMRVGHLPLAFSHRLI